MSRELDKRIAIEVMGWVRVNDDGDQCDYDCWYKAQDDSITTAPQLWRPSTSIADAFLVVAKMREEGWVFTLQFNDGKWWCCFSNYETAISEEADTPAEAISLAALKVKEGR